MKRGDLLNYFGVMIFVNLTVLCGGAETIPPASELVDK
jgi:hypothetical protein